MVQFQPSFLNAEPTLPVHYLSYLPVIYTLNRGNKMSVYGNLSLFAPLPVPRNIERHILPEVP